MLLPKAESREPKALREWRQRNRILDQIGERAALARRTGQSAAAPARMRSVAAIGRVTSTLQSPSLIASARRNC